VRAEPESPNQSRIPAWIGLGTAVIGLGASLSSAVDYFAPEPAFCGDTGCASVKSSAFSSVLGVPTPLLGVAFFSLAIVLSFSARTLPSWTATARRPIALAGGVVGIGLILVQGFAVHAWCKLCLVADMAGILHAAVVLGGARRISANLWSAAPIAPATAAVVGVLALWTKAPAEPPIPAGVPDVVAKELTTQPVREGVTEVTVVEFVDFECPFCRDMQARLHSAIEQVTHQVRVVRKMAPLAQHRGAMPAALAWCCAEAQGRGDEMANALFSAPPEDLTPEGCQRLAECIGLDMERYRQALEDPSTKDRIAADLDDASAAGVHKLPTLFVGETRVTGASRSTHELVALLDDAARSSSSSSQSSSPSSSQSSSSSTL